MFWLALVTESGRSCSKKVFTLPYFSAFNLALTSRCSRCTGIQYEGEHNQCVELILRKMFIVPSFEIHGGVKGKLIVFMI